MAHRKVSIFSTARPLTVWKYLKPAIGTNNKIRPGFGLLHGTPTKLDDGYRYVLNVSGKWIPAGDTPKEAQQAAELKQAELAYVAVGGEVQEEKSETAQAPKTKITDSIAAYLAGISADVAARTSDHGRTPAPSKSSTSSPCASGENPRCDMWRR